MKEPFFIQAEEVLHQRCPAARWRLDDENGLVNRLPLEASKENMVQGPRQNHQHQKKQEQPAEQKHIAPAPEPERLPEQRQRFRLQEQFVIKVHPVP